MMKRILLLVITALLTACAAPPASPAAPATTSSRPAPAPASPQLARPAAPSASVSPQITIAPSMPPVATNVQVADTNEYEFPRLLPFDGILPVYDPKFAGAAQAPLLDEELVIGIALGGEAKAYPITVLRFREMVDDELAGIPILVTW